MPQYQVEFILFSHYLDLRPQIIRTNFWLFWRKVAWRNQNQMKSDQKHRLIWPMVQKCWKKKFYEIANLKDISNGMENFLEGTWLKQ